MSNGSSARFAANVSTMWLCSMRGLCDASCRVIVPITVIGELICRCTKTPRKREQYSPNLGVKSSRYPKLVVCIIITNGELRDRLSRLLADAQLLTRGHSGPASARFLNSSYPNPDRLAINIMQQERTHS